MTAHSPPPREPVDLAQFEGHTPGPWQRNGSWSSGFAPSGETGASIGGINHTHGAYYTNDVGERVFMPSTVHIVDVRTGHQDGKGVPEWEANARLIAAAPDLLAEVLRLRAALAVERSTRHEEAVRLLQQFVEAYDSDNVDMQSAELPGELDGDGRQSHAWHAEWLYHVHTFLDAAARIRALGQEGKP